MSPRNSTLLALVGVLLAGIPLPALTTAARREAPAEAKPAPAATHPVYATLHWSGQPVGLRLLHEGRELASLSTGELLTCPWEGELVLPSAPVLHVEIMAQWPESEQAQAASLTLEPEGQPAQQSTQWTTPGDSNLHSLFSFTW